MMKKIYLLLITLIYNFLLSQGPELPKVISPSPNVSSLRKYGEIPVNNYTGVPSNIIPLYTVKSGDIEVPISVSYHSSGNKVTDEASWVGLGWSLNAGGIITRQVRGIDDFGSGGYLGYGMYDLPPKSNTFTIMNTYQRIKYSLYPYSTSYPQSVHEVITPTMKAYSGGYISSQVFGSNGLDSYGYLSDMDPLVGPQDGEPDIYHFNFLGYSGKLLIKKNSTGGLKIVSTEDGQLNFSYNIDTKKWTVKDIRGIEYEFGVLEYSRSRQKTCNQSEEYVSETNITGWYINKIKSPIGEEITFEYFYDNPSSIGGVNIISPNGIEEQGNIQWKNSIGAGDTKSYFTTSTAGLCIPMDNREIYNRTTKNYTESYEKYLKRIDFKEGYVEFAMNPSNRDDRNPSSNGTSIGSLNNFTVYDKINNIIERVGFVTSYFNQDKINLANKQDYLRLKLDAVVLHSTSNNPQWYRFQYNDIPLPSKDSYSVDQWGYYNGATNNNIQKYRFQPISSSTFSLEISEQFNKSLSTLIPYYDYIDSNLVVRLDGANRTPNAEFIEASILKAIYYPTGGRTNFEYEPNTYYKSDGKNISEATYDVTALGTAEKTFTISEKSFVKLEYNFTNNSSPYEYSDTQIYPKVLATDVSLERQGGTVGRIRFLPLKIPSGQNNLEYFSRQTRTSIAVLLEPGTYKIKTNNGGFVYFDLSLKAIVQNRYASINQIGAGLRIKSVKNIDGTGSLQEKQFSYNIGDGSSSGKIMSPLFNFYNATSYMEGYMSNPPSLPYFTDMESAFINSLKNPIYKRNQPIANFIEASGSSFLPLGNSAAGQSIGYSQVTVSNVNAVPFSSQKNIGKSVYKYNNFPDVLFGTFVPYVKKDRQYDENGQLINEYHYDSTDNLLSEKEYKYNLGESFSIPGLRIMRSSSPYCFINPFGANNGSMSPPCDEMVKGVIFDRFYEEKINWWYPNKIIEKNYPSVGATPIITTKNISYDNSNHKQITKEETIFPDGSTTKKTYQYADEMDSQLMKSKNMIGIPLVSSIQKTIDGTTKTLQKVETYFPKTSAETSSTNGLLLPLSTKTYALDNLASPNNFVTYDKYDSNGNILQYSEKGINPVSFIWGYNKTLPIAKIEGVGYDTLMGISEISSLVDDLVSKSNQDTDANSEHVLIQKLDAFRSNSNLSNYQVSTYTYNPLIGLTSVTLPSGIREMYTYDDNNRLRQIIDMNGNIVKENKYNYSNIMADNPIILNIVGPNTIGSTNATATYTFTMPNMPTDLHYYWSINPSVGASYPMPYDSPTVSTTFTNSGVYTIKLVAYKASSGESISVSKIINVNLSSSSPSYNGSNLNGINPTVFQTSGLYINGNSVSGYFVFRPGIFAGIKDIALIPSDKIPSTDRIVNYSEINSAAGINRQWTFTFKTIGVLSASYSGTPLTNTTDVTVNSFQYQKQ